MSRLWSTCSSLKVRTTQYWELVLGRTSLSTALYFSDRILRWQYLYFWIWFVSGENVTVVCVTMTIIYDKIFGVCWKNIDEDDSMMTSAGVLASTPKAFRSTLIAAGASDGANKIIQEFNSILSLHGTPPPSSTSPWSVYDCDHKGGRGNVFSVCAHLLFLPLPQQLASRPCTPQTPWWRFKTLGPYLSQVALRPKLDKTERELWKLFQVLTCVNWQLTLLWPWWPTWWWNSPPSTLSGTTPPSPINISIQVILIDNSYENAYDTQILMTLHMAF